MGGAASEKLNIFKIWKKFDKIPKVELFATMGACNLPPLSSAKTIGQIFIRAAAQSPVLLTEQRQYVATQLHRVMAADSEDF